jgi:ammonia channel protein AmtB
MIDTGNTAFMILCTSLVMLMTPGLAFFYGGLVGRKNVLTIMMQSYVSLGVTTVIWYLFLTPFAGPFPTSAPSPAPRVLAWRTHYPV